MDKVKEVSIRRCKNRPVKAIAKELGMNREDVEKIISKLIRDTNPYLDELVKGRKINTITIDISPLVEKSDFTKEYAQTLLNDDRVLDYIAMKRGDYHDRLMDCIRYHVFLLMR
ncbi:hypothetical protein [Sulfuracidifex metallicus]|nr:hypothetical protein [Sulfuracidifex metallicus]WOE51677.1 hypothetical protein RQ359_001002 [Sulfuracidifex metallicus DSM 6482 = JCM 9184]